MLRQVSNSAMCDFESRSPSIERSYIFRCSLDRKILKSIVFPLKEKLQFSKSENRTPKKIQFNADQLALLSREFENSVGYWLELRTGQHIKEFQNFVEKIVQEEAII